MANEPTVTVDPTLETAASALRADLAARGVPADELPEPVVLALAVVIERIMRLETVAYPPVVVQSRENTSSEGIRQVQEVIRRMRAGSAADTPPEAPRFRHDCPDCVFLGRSEDGAADLYHCEGEDWPHVTARHGDDRSDFAGIAYLRSGSHTAPHLAEAYRQAVARRLAGGAGEGE